MTRRLWEDAGQTARLHDQKPFKTKASFCNRRIQTYSGLARGFGSAHVLGREIGVPLFLVYTHMLFLHNLNSMLSMEHHLRNLNPRTTSDKSAQDVSLDTLESSSLGAYWLDSSYPVCHSRCRWQVQRLSGDKKACERFCCLV